jgi:hypothetical protein
MPKQNYYNAKNASHPLQRKAGGSSRSSDTLATVTEALSQCITFDYCRTHWTNGQGMGVGGIIDRKTLQIQKILVAGESLITYND